ncbi:MAG TPA: DUF5666 domain-containing protein [Terriglobia bacterium]|nr:DUF5666 domain-containing protein [Terriglobia bacterium]
MQIIPRRKFAPMPIMISAAILLLTVRALQSNSLYGSVPSQDASRFTLQGKINKVDTGKFTVNTEENILFHVRYDDKTQITRADGSAGSPKDLRVGVVVAVEGDLEESGEIAAATIKLQGKEPQKQ